MQELKEDLKLFTVEIETQVFVLAKDKDQAVEVARSIDSFDLDCCGFDYFARDYRGECCYPDESPFSKKGDNPMELSIEEIQAIFAERKKEKDKEDEIDKLQYKLPLDFSENG